jgi:hypothetical protein
MADDRGSQTPGSSSMGLQNPGYAACNPRGTLGGWVRAEEVVEALLRKQSLCALSPVQSDAFSSSASAT